MAGVFSALVAIRCRRAADRALTGAVVGCVPGITVAHGSLLVSVAVEIPRGLSADAGHRFGAIGAALILSGVDPMLPCHRVIFDDLVLQLEDAIVERLGRGRATG